MVIKGKKKKRGKKPPAGKKKVLKVGGLWVDSKSFPAFDDGPDPDPPTRP